MKLEGFGRKNATNGDGATTPGANKGSRKQLLKVMTLFLLGPTKLEFARTMPESGIRDVNVKAFLTTPLGSLPDLVVPGNGSEGHVGLPYVSNNQRQCTRWSLPGNRQKSRCWPSSAGQRTGAVKTPKLPPTQESTGRSMASASTQVARRMAARLGTVSRL